MIEINDNTKIGQFHILRLVIFVLDLEIVSDEIAPPRFVLDGRRRLYFF